MAAGTKMTFWELLSQKEINLPTLQRDYVYGANTTKTNEVLNNMLNNFYQALSSTTPYEITLQFVYGDTDYKNQFHPLDGQQRLTTLYLLHYYAALIANPAASVADFNVIKKFSYATRNNTKEFCENLIAYRNNIQTSVGKSSLGNFIKEQPWFRFGYYNDPSIRSMVFVLNRIQEIFSKNPSIQGSMFATLTNSQKCPINFNLLDFGQFGLGDDLYIKMNSRGKTLTDYEIIKSEFLKHIEHNISRKISDDFAVKLDTTWSDMVWNILNRTKNLKEIDIAFLNIFRNVFRIIDYLRGAKQGDDSLDEACLIKKSRQPELDILIDFLDIFYNNGAHNNSTSKLWTNWTNGIPLFNNSKNDNLLKDLVDNPKLEYRDLLLIYAVYQGLKSGCPQADLQLRFRHIRNLVRQSGDQIRESNMTGLLRDVKNVMIGNILKINLTTATFQKEQFREEQEKERYATHWRNVFCYEDMKELQGTIEAFCQGLMPNNALDLYNTSAITALDVRLKKFAYLFNSISNEDERRKILFGIGDFTMSDIREQYKRYMGIRGNDWLEFFGRHQYDERDNIMNVIDIINISIPVNSQGTLPTTDNWRYYIYKYFTDIRVGQGYLLMQTSRSSQANNNIDFRILNSASHGVGNLFWCSMNRIVNQKFSNTYKMFLDAHNAAPILLSDISPNAIMNMEADGWHLKNISSPDLTAVGIAHTVVSTSPNAIDDNLCQHTSGVDYIKEAEDILAKLATKWPIKK